jgi:glycosidase
MSKIIIYQIFTRLYSNRCQTRKYFGSIQENGCGKFNDFTPEILDKVKKKGVSHVWYTGVIRHATMTDYSSYGIPRQHPAIVKGRAGSPYAITDYYDVDPDLAVDVDDRMQEFEHLVNRTHRAGMKVIIDFVPNHVARQYHSICKPKGVMDLGEDDNPQNGFDPQNNFYYCPGQRFAPHFSLYGDEREPYVEDPAKSTGNDCFRNDPDQNDWYETVKLNYGVDYYAGRIGYFTPVPSTWRKMADILLFWASKGIDGFRCDMAEMVPAEFWTWAISQVKKKYPEVVFIGEVYNPDEYRHYIAGGFDYLYDKVGMYDTMFCIIRGEETTSAITRQWQTTDDIHDHMLYFLENHDELRIASDFFAGDGRKAFPAFVVSALLQRNPLMIYAGQEYGERGMDEEGFSGLDGRTTIFDYWSLDSLCRASEGRLSAEEEQLSEDYSVVLNIALTEKAVKEGLTYDLMYVNRQYDRQFMFLRKKGVETLMVVVNFEDAVAEIDVRIPAHAFEFLKLLEGNYEAKNLLRKECVYLTLKADGVIRVKVPKRGALILKF